MELTINGELVSVEAADDTPLLWVLRDIVGLTGTKFGCGIAMCGACTVLVNGEPRRSCSLAAGDVEGEITTIEGLASGLGPSVVQQAWIDHQVAQCGYCQSGQILAATALLARNPEPSDADIDEAMSGNLCRCGTYPRIRAAVRTAARKLAGT